MKGEKTYILDNCSQRIVIASISDVNLLPSAYRRRQSFASGFGQETFLFQPLDVLACCFCVTFFDSDILLIFCVQ